MWGRTQEQLEVHLRLHCPVSAQPGTSPCSDTAKAPPQLSFPGAGGAERHNQGWKRPPRAFQHQAAACSTGLQENPSSSAPCSAHWHIIKSLCVTKEDMNECLKTYLSNFPGRFCSLYFKNMIRTHYCFETLAQHFHCKPQTKWGADEQMWISVGQH